MKKLSLLSCLLLVSCGGTFLDASEATQSGSLVNGGEKTTCFPQVAHLTSRFDENSSAVCTGVLLENGILATTANCAHLLGASAQNRKTDVSFSTPQGKLTFSVASNDFKLHPDYLRCVDREAGTPSADFLNAMVDVAFVRLKTPPSTIQPAQMSDESLEEDFKTNGRVLFVSTGLELESNSKRVFRSSVDWAGPGAFGTVGAPSCDASNGSPVYLADENTSKLNVCSNAPPKFLGLTGNFHGEKCGDKKGYTWVTSFSGVAGQFLQAAITGKEGEFPRFECCPFSEKKCQDGSVIECTGNGVWEKKCPDEKQSEGGSRGEQDSHSNDFGGGGLPSSNDECNYAKGSEACHEESVKHPDQDCEFSVKSCSCACTGFKF